MRAFKSSMAQLGLFGGVRLQRFQGVFCSQFFDAQLGFCQRALARPREFYPALESFQRLVQRHIAGLHLLDQLCEFFERCFEIDLLFRHRGTVTARPADCQMLSRLRNKRDSRKIAMDLATLVGILGAFGIVVAAMILGGSAGMFVNIPSLLIVLVGTLFVVLMKFSLSQFLGAVKVAAKAFSFKLATPQEIIEEVVALADEARKGGLLSLEGKEVSSDFLQKGIQLLVDGHDADVVRTLLRKDLSQSQQRHDWGAKIFSAMGDVGPAMGMIGTLVGLVQMLANMDDPKSIGPAMAVALLTTLYGAMLANMFALPVADKLALRRVEEGRVKSMAIDALLAIQAGQNPRVIDQMLKAYVPESTRQEDE